MPHAGHFILGDLCRFRLNTYVGKYLVSTVGELWNERVVREIHAKVTDPAWWGRNVHMKGDAFDGAYMKRFGFEEIGYGRKYETLVFKAGRSNHKCCPYAPKDYDEIDARGYNSPEDAYRGHLGLCEKWSKL